MREPERSRDCDDQPREKDALNRDRQLTCPRHEYYYAPVRVVIDTCVWVSAIRSRVGASYQVLSEIPSGRFHFGISVPLFLEHKQELLTAVKQGRSRLDAKQVDAILAALAHFCHEVPVFFRLRPNLKDPSDDMVFECAAHFGASHIVTFNVKDFENPELKGYPIEVITPGEFLGELKRRTES